MTPGTGFKANDVVVGGPGKDRLLGAGGADRMLGGKGADSFAAEDGVRDIVKGGPGIDTARVDRKDRVRNVERRLRQRATRDRDLATLPAARRSGIDRNAGRMRPGLSFDVYSPAGE